MDSGGPFGGGVPASAVRTLMRKGLAAGLTDEQVRAFLQPGFLRGMSDPRGGAGCSTSSVSRTIPRSSRSWRCTPVGSTGGR